MSYAHCGCRYEDAREQELAQESYRWTLRHVRPETRRYLAALPFRLDVRPAGGHASGGQRIVLVHGTPTLNTVYWTEDRDASFCLKMAEAAGARAGDVIAFGHTHLPWRRELDGIHFVNTGSVGRPKDGDPRAGYVIVDVDGGEVELSFVRVDYDLERAAQAIRASELPDEFADQLVRGGA